MNGMVQQPSENNNGTRVEPIKSMSEISGSINMRSKNVGVVKTSSLLSKHSPRFTRRCSINNCHQTKPSKTSLELAPMESKDIFTQIIQSPPPPPAPNIPKNSEVAEVSIARTPAQRRQAPEGNCATNKHSQLRHHLETGV
ncbi:hypothetical protein ACHAW5_007442 [Stephanodiscus triporus]|uniref:Uncharacterized protein n=1 Tax=Stephanodiscus triporus TaxID=2934178 RepID=A0ABD3NG45_9STRA